MTAIRSLVEPPLYVSIERAFAESQSALPSASEPSVDEPGISAFPRLKAYDRETRAVDRVVKQLRGLRRYAERWDGYDAAAPRAEAINDASDLVSRLLRNDVLFEVSAEPDGSVNLSLEGAGRRLTFVFEGDGKVQLLFRTGQNWEDQGIWPIGGRPGMAAAQLNDAVSLTS